MNWLKNIYAKAVEVVKSVYGWVLSVWSKHKRTLIIAALLMGGAWLVVHVSGCQAITDAVDSVELPEVSCGLMDEAKDADTEVVEE